MEGSGSELNAKILQHSVSMGICFSQFGNVFSVSHSDRERAEESGRRGIKRNCLLMKGNREIMKNKYS